MDKIRILSVFGTRPEAIKMAPVAKALAANDAFISAVCVTGQHREMLDSVLAEFNIEPNFDLNIMTRNQSLTDITVKALTGVGRVINAIKPAAVLVHGDTTTSFAAALAAFYAKVPVGHVEAGLRSGNIREPYPEEMNRRQTDAFSSYHFAPTKRAKDALIQEGVSADNIFITGNTEIDAIRALITDGAYTFDCPALNAIDFNAEKVVAITAHRRENIGAPLESICRAIKSLAQIVPDSHFVYAVHPNPAVVETVRGCLEGVDNVTLTEPLSFKDMYYLVKRSRFVMTDSGGLQEGSCALNKPCVVLRSVTERPEGVDAGGLVLVGHKFETILDTARTLFADSPLFRRMSSANSPFGDGFAASRIADAAAFLFGKGARPADFSPTYKAFI